MAAAASMKTSESPSIVVLDDHVVARTAIADALRAQLRCRVFLSSSETEEAVRTARDARPGTILVDSRLRDHDTARLTSTLRNRVPTARVVVTGLTSHHSNIMALVEAGACGFIMKEASADEYTTTVRTVTKGGFAFASTSDGWTLPRDKSTRRARSETN